MTANIQEYAFPTVGIIRKGAPKGKDQPGKDLQEKLRVAWQPGADFARQAWDKTYGPGNYQPTEIHAMLFLPKVEDSLQIFNEAYQAGRMVLRADDRQVLMKKDPLTGKYLVRDGDPFEAYAPGLPVTYTRGDKTYTLPVRTSIRLKIFIPELGLPVQFVLKSTSYYDAVNLRQQMGAIQVLANMLNKGIAGGIPIIIYRASQEITWNKKDGSAARIAKWLINVRVDERWIAAATQRMSQFAFTGQQAVGLLKPPEHIHGDEDPSLEDTDPDPDEVKGEYEETPLADKPAEMNFEERAAEARINQTELYHELNDPKNHAPDCRCEYCRPGEPPEEMEPPQDAGHPQDGTGINEPKEIPTASEQGLPQPILGSTPAGKIETRQAEKLDPEEVRERITTWEASWAKKQEADGRKIVDAPLLRTTIKTVIEEALDGVAIHNAQTVAQARNEVTDWLTGYRSMDKMPIGFVRALKAWLHPDYDETDHLVANPTAAAELRNVYRQAVGLPDFEK